jgi:hypothetical protein
MDSFKQGICPHFAAVCDAGLERKGATAIKKSFCFFFFRGFNSEMHSE